MKRLGRSHKLLILEGGRLALFTLSTSSKNSLDKITRLCSYSIGFEIIKVYNLKKKNEDDSLNKSDRKKPLPEIDFDKMDEDDATACFSKIGKETKVRLVVNENGDRTMLLPLN